MVLKEVNRLVKLLLGEKCVRLATDVRALLIAIMHMVVTQGNVSSYRATLK